ncbi:MAG: hypothetical protein G01um101466_245 [Parcubacteria group bacterium Gr01-1014_66]|nr:MAG: hypothetical protein G01um101466_245 [Parcubacteria group bacterium Gr01-1014_66]
MGFLVGIVSALTVSIQNSFFKGYKEVSPFVLNWFRFLIAMPVLALIVSIFSEWSLPAVPFWLLLFCVSLPAELIHGYTYIRAFQESPQSMVGPLFSISPLFLIPLGYMFLDEAPSLLGFFGVISVVIGPFFLGKGKTGGVKNLFHERGIKFMIAAAFFAALAVTVGKFSLHYVPPFLFAFFSVVTLFLGTSLIVFYQRLSLRLPFNKSFVGVTFSYPIIVALHYLGLSLLFAAYYISLKRFSIVFDVILGRLVHHEDHFRERMIGALFMVAGVLLIAFG